jgi:septal ring factor EnvC (AmiA/AmiB activator)
MEKVNTYNGKQWIKVDWHTMNGKYNESHYRDFNLNRKDHVEQLAETINLEETKEFHLQEIAALEKEINKIKSSTIYSMKHFASMKKEGEKLDRKIKDLEDSISKRLKIVKISIEMATMTDREKCIALYEYNLGHIS